MTLEVNELLVRIKDNRQQSPTSTAQLTTHGVYLYFPDPIQ